MLVAPPGNLKRPPRSRSENEQNDQRSISGKEKGHPLRKLETLEELPLVPAVYALYGGRTRNRHVAYVGVAGKLKQRIVQHIVNRDSSVTTGTSAAMLNPDHVSEVRWWEHSDFEDPDTLNAAEMVAFEVLNPALRSRGAAQHAAREIAPSKRFVATMTKLFDGEPTGKLVLPTLETALARIRGLEARVHSLEDKLS